MLGALALAAMVSLSKAERAEYETPPHNTLRDCGDRPPDVGECRLPPGLSAADIETQLAGKDTAWWRDGDQFVVVARRDTDQAYLCCAARGRMDHVSGDLWALRLHIADLDRATIDVFVQPEGAIAGAYRGPDAPPRPTIADTLQGQIVNVTLKSDYLDAPRSLTIYLPPGYDPSKKYPVLYEADGVIRREEAKFVEPMILNGQLPPMIVVGIWPGITAQDLLRRSEEYLFGWPNGAPFFLKHESFMLKEVLPYMESKYGASSDPAQRIVTGFSSGSAWAASMGVRHPDVFRTVIAQSIGWPGAEKGADAPSATRFFLSAGTLEPVFYKETISFADVARASGHEVKLETTVSGHTETIWRPTLLDGLKWAFAKSD